MKHLRFLLAILATTIGSILLAQSTQIQASQCGSTIASVSTYIYADAVGSATQYKFQLVNGATTLEFISASRAFRFQNLPGFDYGVTYQVSVAVDTGAGFGAFGASCNVTSPLPVANTLLASYCGTTLASMGTNLYASSVYGATQYRFTVSDGVNPAVELVKSVRYFNMLEVAGYQFGTNYSVTVSYKLTDAVGFHPDGPVCSFTTTSLPSTTLSSSYCNTTLPSLTSNIFANSVTGASQYRFKIVNGASEFILTESANYFNLSELGAGNYNFGTTYTISVAAGTNGNFSDYGAACTVTTPSAVTTKLLASSCGVTLSSISSYLYATTVSGATQYRFLVYRAGQDTLPVLTKTGRFFRFTEFVSGSYFYGTTYTVKVAVNVGSGFGNYGDACTVTLPNLSSVGTTTVTPAFANTTIENLQFDSLSVVAGVGVEAYQIRIVNGAYSATITKTGTKFAFMEFAGYAYNTTYAISVRMKKSGNWGSYGTVTNVSTNPYPETYIQTEQCNSTVASFGTRVYARGIGNVEEYKFRFNNGGAPIEYALAGRSFRFSDVPGLVAGQTYSVDVAVKWAGSYYQYSDPCNITFPSGSTVVQTSQCGATLSTLTTPIYANTVSGATNYKFSVTKSSGGSGTAVSEELILPRRYFNLSELSAGAAQFNATYSIQVATEINGVYSGFGAACNVSTPSATTQVQASQCGATLGAVGTNIYANSINGVTNYRFHVVKVSGGTAVAVDQVYDINRRYFNLTNLGAGNFQAGATYSIEVSCFANGSYQPYGPSCNVTTP